MYGFAKYILHVDLSRKKIWKELLTEEIAQNYLGGRGINALLLWEKVTANTEPLSSQNVIIFGTGTLTGTHVPSSGRITVTFKSPATNLYAKSSAGGNFSTSLKFSRYNHIIIYGCSDKPVYLSIDNEDVRICNAEFLWGKNIKEANELIKNKLNDDELETACIGQAGENLVKFASIVFSGHSVAGRCGCGTVMGSKKLKAIVVKGRKSVKVADPKKFGQLALESTKILMNYSARKEMAKYGTARLVPARNYLHLLPTHNFQKSHLEGAEKFSGQHLVKAGYVDKTLGCNACGTACHRHTSINSGKYAGTSSAGPEYETVASFGAGCGVVNPEAILKANELCNDYGMDTISTGGVIQWAMECFEKGVITQKDTEGLSLMWGNEEAMIELIKKIAFRKGFGKILSEGVKRASEIIGQDSDQWAIQIKGLEYSRAEIRARMGYALALAVNPRGGDHLHSQVYAEFGASPEARDLIKKICGDEKFANALLTDKRAEIVRWHEDCYAVSDSLGLCTFCTLGNGYLITPEIMSNYFTTLTGIKISESELMKIGRKIINIEKAFNVREGLNRSDDIPPKRFFNEPIQSGPFKGRKLNINDFNKMLDDYYQLHGWSVKDGYPTFKTLETLGLVNIAKELVALSKIKK